MLLPLLQTQLMLALLLSMPSNVFNSQDLEAVYIQGLCTFFERYDVVHAAGIGVY